MPQESILLNIAVRENLESNQTGFRNAILRFPIGQAGEMQRLLRDRISLVLIDACLKDGGEEAAGFLSRWLSQKSDTEVEVFPVSMVGYYQLNTLS